jgi:hypothetical protein
MAELCALCGASFASPSELLTHVRKSHPAADGSESLAMNPESRTWGYVCALCGRRFATPTELAAHDLRPHPAPRRLGRPSRS